MENIRRIYWITAGIAAIYFLSGIIVSIMAGFEPVLVMAGVFSLIGVLAAFHGAHSHSQAWWACGILVTGFMTPTPWGIVPMIISLVIVAAVLWMEWQQFRREQEQR